MNQSQHRRIGMLTGHSGFAEGFPTLELTEGMVTSPSHFLLSIVTNQATLTPSLLSHNGSV